MPTPKTECTEISVGMGLLGVNPTSVLLEDLEYLFDGTLSSETYLDYVREYQARERYYRRFYLVGVRVRQNHRVLSRVNISSVQWDGQNQQAKTVSVAKDITVANIPISIKATSNVVANPSPHSLFVSLPSGTSTETHSVNWYLQTAPEQFQNLYEYVLAHSGIDAPPTIYRFLAETREAERKLFARTIDLYTRSELAEFKQLYWNFCRHVAQVSADKFNTQLEASLASRRRNSVIENLIRRLFRIGDLEYVLCGLDQNKEFAVTLPDITSWKRSWAFQSLVATPLVSAEQSKVQLSLKLRNLRTPSDCILPFHVEIRWSHGKFNGSPEAKLYKDFRWVDVPFFEVIWEP